MASMREIATRLGLSRTTVSNILNNLEGKSYRKETVDIVRKTAAEMGYIQNQLATSLKTGKSRTIAIVVPDIANDFYIRVIQEVERLSTLDNYNLIVSITEEDQNREARALEMLRGKMVDGILISPISYSQSLRDFPPSVNVICFDRYVNSDQILSVSINNYGVGKKLAEEMLRAGCRHPLFLGGNTDDITNQRRLAGLMDCWQENGIAISEEDVIFGVYREEQAYEAVCRVLEQKKEYDSFFLTTNNFIYGVIHAVSKYALPIKSIAGFEDFSGRSFTMQQVQYHLIFAVQPEESIARIAYHELQCLIDGDEGQNRQLSNEDVDLVVL